MKARIFLAVPALLLGLLMALPPLQADGAGWVFGVADNPHGPPKFLAVDKKNQTFFYFKQQSPLELVHRLPCTTGQGEGDKLKSGDLKTPEGVYFIDRKLSGLDFELYGDLAYTLNFPNPIDIINGKTGHGIWIHGRGHTIVPNETKGCVALNTPDLHRLGDSLGRGLPVIIADTVVWPSGQASASEQAAFLTQQTLSWASAWQARSPRFFDYYDTEKFPLAEGKPFSFFKEHKNSLFSKNPWIHVLIDDIKAIEGPDYWITYFNQFYRTPTVTSEGWKRLYWQKDKNGQWKIVGNEWESAQLGMEKKYLDQVEEDVLSVLKLWRTAWEKGELSRYVSFYDKQAVQGDRRGPTDIEAHKKTLWAAKKPKKVEMENVRLSLHQNGVQVEFTQIYQSSDGSGDKGHKTIVLAPSGDSWNIIREDWASL